MTFMKKILDVLDMDRHIATNSKQDKVDVVRLKQINPSTNPASNHITMPQNSEKKNDTNVKENIKATTVPQIKQTDTKSVLDTIPNIEHLKKRANRLILWAHELKDTINTTTDRDCFNASFDNLLKTLEELKEYEKYNFFKSSTPSKDLERILSTEHLIRETFEQKIAIEKKKSSNAYISKRLIIQGLHMYFIDVARDVISSGTVLTIPLMREYHISENTLSQIIKELQIAGVLDRDNHVIMSSKEFEHFIDIYEPSIFACENTVFDKDIFMCIGEIIYDDGIEKTYDSLKPDEVVDYLNIMEKLKIIKYNAYENKYDILVSKDQFNDICKCIPNSFSSISFSSCNVSYDNIDYDNLTGIEFETFCAYVLSKNEYKNITITPPSGDHGVDILSEKDDISYAIQCKCYSSNIGNAAVQQAHTGKSLYHKDVAVVMTNQYFTQQAKEEAAKLGVKLWDRDKLNEFIKNAK